MLIRLALLETSCLPGTDWSVKCGSHLILTVVQGGLYLVDPFYGGGN